MLEVRQDRLVSPPVSLHCTKIIGSSHHHHDRALNGEECFSALLLPPCPYDRLTVNSRYFPCSSPIRGSRACVAGSAPPYEKGFQSYSNIKGNRKSEEVLLRPRESEKRNECMKGFQLTTSYLLTYCTLLFTKNCASEVIGVRAILELIAAERLRRNSKISFCEILTSSKRKLGEPSTITPKDGSIFAFERAATRIQMAAIKKNSLMF